MQKRFRPLPVSLALCALLFPAGCEQVEKMMGGEKKTEEKAPEPEKKAPEPKKDDGAKKVLTEKEAEIAALKAEAAAAKEALEAANAEKKELQDELDKPPEPEDEIGKEQELKEGQTGPVGLAKFAFGHEKGKYGHAKDRHQVKATVEVTRNEDKKGGLYAKASCLVGKEVMVDVVTISNEHGDLGKMAVKEAKPLEKVFFQRDGLAEKPARCQFTYDFGASDFSVKLKTVCWDGKEAKDGECAEKLEPHKEGDGKLVPFGFSVAVNDALVKPHGTPEDATPKSLFVRYAGRFNEAFDRAPHLYLKTACKAGEKTWVEVNPDYPHVKPFSLSNGEVIPFGHAQFFLNPLPVEPESCEMSVLYTEKFGEPEKVLASACWKTGGEVSDGSCQADKPPRPEAEPASADSLELGDLQFHWKEHYAEKDKSMLIVNLSATVKKTLEKSNRLHLQATCDGTEDKDHLIGPDLGQLDPGESVAVTLTAYATKPIAPNAKQCEIKVKASKSFSGDDAVDIGSICIKGEEAKLGSCKAKKKPTKKKPKGDGKKDGEKKDGEKKEDDTKGGGSTADPTKAPSGTTRPGAPSRVGAKSAEK